MRNTFPLHYRDVIVFIVKRNVQDIMRDFNVNLSQPCGHYMYRQFNIRQFFVLPIQCICVFCVDLGGRRIIKTKKH
jgi:hypothetical protein